MEATEGPLSKTAPESGAEPPSPIPGRHTLTNAPGTHSCQPAFIYAPSTLDEIQLVVRAAGEAGRHVRVAGGLRSHGDAAMTKDVVVSLERYGRVHMIDCDKAIIMVQAGVTMGRLHDKLASFELALPQFGSDPDVTLAGALSMGEGGESWHGRDVRGTGLTCTLQNRAKRLNSLRKSVTPVGRHGARAVVAGTLRFGI